MVKNALRSEEKPTPSKIRNVNVCIFLANDMQKFADFLIIVNTVSINYALRPDP
jgi:hypothetical protein